MPACLRHAVGAVGAMIALASLPAAADVRLNSGGTSYTVKGYVDPSGANVPYNGQYLTPMTRGGSSGMIASANASQQALGANAARRGGYCQADPRNTDVLALSFGGTANASVGAAADCFLTAGGACPLTLGGTVFQGAVSVTSPSAGQGYACTEAQ